MTTAERTPRASATRRLGPYAPLSAFYADDDAILQLDLEEDSTAELLFVRGLAFCARNTRLDGFLTDATVSGGRVLRRGKKSTVVDAAERLVSVGLWIRETGGYRIANWAKWNRTHAEIEAKRGYDTSRKAALTKAIRDQVYSRDGWKCVFCGSTVGLSIDHIIPMAAGGGHELENLQTLCKSCNSSKGARQPKRPDASDEDRRQSAEEAQSDRGESPDESRMDPGATEDSLTRGRAGAAHPEALATQPNAAAAANDAAAIELQTALARAGISVAWDVDEAGTALILEAIDRCGIPALVKHATSRWQRDNPAFSVRAFVAGWQALPAKPQPLELVPDPCEHGFEFSSRCAHCRAVAS